MGSSVSIPRSGSLLQQQQQQPAEHNSTPPQYEEAEIDPPPPYPPTPLEAIEELLAEEAAIKETLENPMWNRRWRERCDRARVEMQIAAEAWGNLDLRTASDHWRAAKDVFCRAELRYWEIERERLLLEMRVAAIAEEISGLVPVIVIPDELREGESSTGVVLRFPRRQNTSI